VQSWAWKIELSIQGRSVCRAVGQLATQTNLVPSETYETNGTRHAWELTAVRSGQGKGGESASGGRSLLKEKKKRETRRLRRGREPERLYRIRTGGEKTGECRRKGREGVTANLGEAYLRSTKQHKRYIEGASKDWTGLRQRRGSKAQAAK